MFQQYPQSDVNEPIPLHEGRFRIRRGDRCVEGSGSARLRWLPSPGIEFDIEITEPFPGVDFNSLTVDLPGFRTENVLAHSMTLGLTSRIRAFASAMESDRQQNLLSVGFQVVNFTDFITPGLSAAPGDPTAIASVNGTERLLGGVTPTGSPTKPVQSVTCATVDLMPRWLARRSRRLAEIPRPLRASEGYRRILLHPRRTVDENRRLDILPCSRRRGSLSR